MAVSDEVALLSAIRDHPDEDTPRLMYADRLDQRGGGANRARAEFIRLSLAPIPEGEDERRWARLSELAERFSPEWLASWPAPVRGRAEFTRGFVEAISITA